MIGTVNLDMTVCAVPGDFEARTSGIGIIVIQEVPDMPATTPGPDICMTLLAQLWPLLVQQCLVVRTMDTVAQCAIFADRGMLPQERTALFSMTGITVLINTELLQG